MTINDSLFVVFDETHNKVFNVGGLELLRADMWLLNDKTNGETQYESNVNKLETHPQMATVVEDSENFKKGDKVFLHYMAKEWEEVYDLDGNPVSLVSENDVLFKILPNGVELAKGTFLGDFVMDEAPKTESGIFLTSCYEKVRNDLKIKITHVPDERIKEVEQVDVDSVVLPVDKNNYVINYDGQSKVVLKELEIRAIL